MLNAYKPGTNMESEVLTPSTYTSFNSSINGHKYISMSLCGDVLPGINNGMMK